MTGKSLSELSFNQEIADRGYAAVLEVVDGDAPVGGHPTRIRLGSRNAEERKASEMLPSEAHRKQARGDMADVAIHPDGSVTLRTFRYATNIPLAELEAVVKIARAAANGELPAEKLPAGMEEVEAPF